MVAEDGLGVQLLYTPTPLDKARAADKLIPLATSMQERLLEKLWLKLSRLVGLEKGKNQASDDGAVRRGPPSKPPLLFVHGSLHSSWCWAENFLPYFSQLGYTCYAVSLRGTAPTGMAYAAKKSQEATSPTGQNSNIQTVQVEQHVSDLKQVLAYIKSSYGAADASPCIVAHSISGVYVMKLLEDPDARALISGAAFLCSVPPSGNGPMTLRFIQTNFIAALKIVYGFVLKGVTYDAALAKELFFDSSLPDSDAARFVQCFKADSKVGLDLGGLARVLPSITSTGADGKATWLLQPQPPPPPRLLVLGGDGDFIVDREGVQETARYCGVEPVFLPTYHDAMLGPKFLVAAEAIRDWLRRGQAEEDKVGEERGQVKEKRAA